MAFRKKSRTRSGVLPLVIAVLSLVMSIFLRLYQHHNRRVAAVVELEKTQGHELLDHGSLGADASCANDVDTTPLLTSTEYSIKDKVLLQKALQRSTIEMNGDSSLLVKSAAQRSGANSSINATHKSSGLAQQSQAPVSVQGPDVAITVERLDCNTPIYAPDGVCPKACPFFAQEGGKTRACFFQCVTGPQCGSGTLDPDDDIADEDELICRKCKVLGCLKCAKGQGERCAVCEPGYMHNDDGTCTSEMWKVWSFVFTIVGVILLFLIAWFVRLQMLPVTNPEGLKEGLAYRSSLKLRVPRGQAAVVGADPNSAARPLWPISTNLHAIQVAGPGLTLHMNFQAAVILWAAGLVVSWVIFTYMTSPDMLTLGLYPVDTPQQMCSVTLRGKEMQKRLLPTKLIYMVFMFVATFAFNVLYALYQRQRFLAMDDDTSMTDFAAMCEGLPVLSGGEACEKDLKQQIEAATGEKVVGVSICWDYKEQEDAIEEAIDREVDMLEECPKLPDQATLDERKKGLGHKIFGGVDTIFGFTGEVPAEEPPHLTEQGLQDLLKNLKSTDTAFIVFESEASRDKAVEVVQKKSTSVQGNPITLTTTKCEPDTLNWTNFKVTWNEFYTKVAIGVGVIIVSLVIWVFGFYVPFAYYQASYAEQGEEPSFLDAFIFSMLVVVGNQIMYFLCATIAEKVGFRFNDSQETLYIGLYTVACTVNLIVDMAMEFFLAYEAAKSANVHTADGVLLEDISDYQKIFDSYVMQRAVGGRLFAYCFPATFLIPFVVEPIFAIFLPYHICKLLLRTHPECRGREAEKSLNFFAPMDMGRYGDLLLNLTLSVLIVLFPPGTFLKMMLALVVSHFFVYVYDQYRIMRCVPAFDYSSDYIDREVQVLMGVPPSIVAAAIVFKGGCLPNSPICVEGERLFWSTIAAFFISFALHTFLIRKVVPQFDERWRTHKVSETTYAEASTNLASTWFSENAVHCLRSKYVYKHNPPCLYNTRGKEHLIRKNPDCGVHFEKSEKVGAQEYEDSYD